MPAAVNTSASSFAIREMDGDKRTLTLRGRGLPYRPLELSGTQRKSIEWYGGNPIGVLQVFGAQEDQTTIRGMWKDIFLSDARYIELATSATDGLIDLPDVQQASQQLVTAQDAARVTDDIRRKGQLVEVTWMNQVRQGIVGKFVQKWHTEHDLEWEITFDWVSQGDTLDDVPFTEASAQDIADVPNQLRDDLDNLQGGAASFSNVEEIDAADDEELPDLIDSIDGIGSKLAAYTDDLEAGVSNFVYEASTPDVAKKRVVGILNGTADTAGEMWDLLQNSADGARLNLGGSFGSVLADRSTTRQQSDVAQQVQVTSVSQQHKIARGTQSNIKAVFVARQDTDLRMVSARYYGTTDDWRGLMIYNDLDSDVVDAGDVVIVPTVLPKVPL